MVIFISLYISIINLINYRAKNNRKYVYSVLIKKKYIYIYTLINIIINI